MLEYLQSHEQVSWVSHPDLPDHSSHELAKKYLPKARDRSSASASKVAGMRARHLSRTSSSLASRECWRRQDADYSSGDDDALAHRCRSAGRCRHYRRHDSPVGWPGRASRISRPILNSAFVPRNDREGLSHVLRRKRQTGLCDHGRQAIRQQQADRHFPGGSALDHTFWGLHSRFFAFRNYSVLCLDTPGHTHSEGPALESIEELGDWVNDVVKLSTSTDVSIVAHSQGCLTALEYVSRYPDRVRSVVFHLQWPRDAGQRLSAQCRSRETRSGRRHDDFLGLWRRRTFAPGTDPGQFNGGRRLQDDVAQCAGRTGVDLNACNNYKNGKQRRRQSPARRR